MPEGLTSAEAARRLAQHGPNALPPPRRDTFLARFVRQFRSPLIFILLFALVFEIAVWLRDESRGFPLEGIAIGLLLLVNALIGAVQDQRSDAALARLTSLASPRAWALRDGRPVQVESAQLVPGDVIRLEAGDRVHADARLAASATLLLDESILTGESVPVEKRAGDELFAGTLVARGKAHAEVTRTGRESALGGLASLLGAIEPGKTPLESRLDRLSRQLARAIMGFAALLLVAAVWIEGSAHLAEIVIFVVALAVAIVPEELPAVLTLTLALGVERMAREKAVVRRLAAVEALGSVTVICTDKTGTLTQNRMHVRELRAVDESRARRAMALANDAERASRVGDPMELALLDFASEVAPARRVSETPFDSAWKFMRVTVEEEGARVSYAKGAPEVVLSRCEPELRARWLAEADTAAREGFRVLALAWAAGETDDAWRFAGIVLLWDPPRDEAAASVAAAQRAGVRVIMVTGDHAATARAVARAVGIREEDVFARVTPEGKLGIVEELQARGEVVAMTGDGVNDAPALKKANVGVAMGLRGSDVAREAASLVLLDDNFATIVRAIEEGRSLGENIQKFLRFMFVIHVAFFLLLVGGAAGSWLVGLRDSAGALVLPLTALQILWINMLADGPTSFALGVDKNPDAMRVPPEPSSRPLLDRASWAFVLAVAAAKTVIAFAILLAMPRAGYSVVETQTAIFAYEYLGQVILAYPARRLRLRPARNLWLHAATGAGAVLVGVFLAWPPARALLGLAPLALVPIALLFVACGLTWIVAEVVARALRPRVLTS